MKYTITYPQTYIAYSQNFLKNQGVPVMAIPLVLPLSTVSWDMMLKMCSKCFQQNILKKGAQ